MSSILFLKLLNLLLLKLFLELQVLILELLKRLVDICALADCNVLWSRDVTGLC